MGFSSSESSVWTAHTQSCRRRTPHPPLQNMWCQIFSMSSQFLTKPCSMRNFTFSTSRLSCVLTSDEGSSRAAREQLVEIRMGQKSPSEHVATVLLAGRYVLPAWVQGETVHQVLPHECSTFHATMARASSPRFVPPFVASRLVLRY